MRANEKNKDGHQNQAQLPSTKSTQKQEKEFLLTEYVVEGSFGTFDQWYADYR